MKSDATIEKIRARVDKVVDEHLSMQHIYKFAIKVGGEVKSTWSKWQKLLIISE